MAENELVLLDEPAKGVRRITLNRPEKRNAISNALEHQGARAIVRTGGDLQAECLRLISAIQLINWVPWPSMSSTALTPAPRS